MINTKIRLCRCRSIRFRAHVVASPLYDPIKKLMHTVNIGEPDLLLETCCSSNSGANSSWPPEMRYTIQGWNCVDDLGRRAKQSLRKHSAHSVDLWV